LCFESFVAALFLEQRWAVPLLLKDYTNEVHNSDYKVIPVLSVLTNYGTHNYAQELLTQDDAFSLPSTQDSPAISFGIYSPRAPIKKLE